MTTPTITPTPSPLPNRSQDKTAFNNAVDSYMTWLEANADELNILIPWIVQSRDDVIAAALAGNLPSLAGFAGQVIVVNPAEDGVVFEPLFEVPAFTGNAGNALVVNGTEDGIEYGASKVNSGTWTPVINAGSTATTTGSDGLYSRVGDMVTVHFHIRGIAKGDIGSSTLTITGLPYAARNLTNSQLQFLGVFNQDGITGITDAQLRLDEGTSSLIFKKAATSDSVSLVTGSDMPTSGAVLNGTITYHTDDPV